MASCRNSCSAVQCTYAADGVEVAMAATVTKQEDKISRSLSGPSSRTEVLARYRHLRAISRRLQREAVNFLSHEAVSLYARRLCLPLGRTPVLNSADGQKYAFEQLDPVDDLTYALDLALHTAPPRRTRAIDRYARTARVAPDSDDALMLAAMRNSTFLVIRVGRRHEAAGMVVTDVYRRSELWLVDEGMERSVPTGALIATRLYAPESFSMTAGFTLLVDAEMLREAIDDVPELDPKRLDEAVNDRRFIEAVYRIALERGVTKRL
jgi:hypothetical protein